MRKTFTKLFILGTLFFSVQVSGQNDPYYTHYMLNKLVYNPATAGEKDAICVNALTHQQWVGLKDQSNSPDGTSDPWKNPISGVNPATNTVSITAPFLKSNQLGLGLMLATDKLGYNKHLYWRASAAWKFRMGRRLPDGSSDQVLAVGADFGMVQAGIDGTKLHALQPGDPNIPTSLQTGSKFDMGFGVYYTHQRLFDGFYAGLSMTHLTAPKVDVANTLYWKWNQYLYLTMGSRHDFGNVAILPSILVRAVNTPFQVDLGCRALFNEKLVVGANVRTRDAISLLVGYYIMPNLYAGYGYDITALSKVNTYTRTGTHELFLSYCFNINPPTKDGPKPRYNVRYLEGYTIY